MHSQIQLSLKQRYNTVKTHLETKFNYVDHNISRKAITERKNLLFCYKRTYLNIHISMNGKLIEKAILM